MNNPEYALIDGKKYKINTDFRIAIKCQEVAMDQEINDVERALTILYLLFGDAAFEIEDKQKLLDIALKYLQCGKEKEEQNNQKKDMDFIQDYRLIQASFKSDYGISINEENIHWWDFFAYLNGLTDKCALNRVREIRNMDISKIKDAKEKNKIKRMQETYALKDKPKPMTDEQRESVDKFYELTGIKRKV